jgi:hypothetical protein
MDERKRWYLIETSALLTISVNAEIHWTLRRPYAPRRRERNPYNMGLIRKPRAHRRQRVPISCICKNRVHEYMYPMYFYHCS